MPQRKPWEKEYNQPKFVTLHSEPQACVLKFLRYLKKIQKEDISNFYVLDLGSGTGRNTNYLAEKSAKAVGIEISKKAIEIAKTRAHKKNIEVTYIHGSIGDKFPLETSGFDLALDVTSSNSLNEAERAIYLSETARILKSNGYLFVRALCKDGDKNAKYLLKKFPGKEADTYILPDSEIVERVFSKFDITEMYQKYFQILEIKKDSGYTTYDNRKFKRNYWLLYLKKA